MGKSKFCSNPLRLPKHKKLKAWNVVHESLALEFMAKFPEYHIIPDMKVCMNCLRALREKIEIEATHHKEPPQVEVESSGLDCAKEPAKHILQVVAPSLHRRSGSETSPSEPTHKEIVASHPVNQPGPSRLFRKSVFTLCRIFWK